MLRVSISDTEKGKVIYSFTSDVALLKTFDKRLFNGGDLCALIPECKPFMINSYLLPMASAWERWYQPRYCVEVKEEEVPRKKSFFDFLKKNDIIYIQG